MYTAQLTIDRIQALIKEKKLTQKRVLEDCDINENTLKRMTDNKGISSFYLAKIADRLNCSVDYLLGRADMPNNIYSVSGDNNVQVNGDNCATSISTSAVHSTSDTAELVQLIESLPLVKRAEAIIYLNELKNKIKNHTD